MTDPYGATISDSDEPAHDMRRAELLRATHKALRDQLGSLAGDENPIADILWDGVGKIAIESLDIPHVDIDLIILRLEILTDLMDEADALHRQLLTSAIADLKKLEGD